MWAEDADELPPLGAQTEHDAEKLIILIDFTGWTLSTAPPMRTSRETLTILQDHFPERLAVVRKHKPMNSWFLKPRTVSNHQWSLSNTA